MENTENTELIPVAPAPEQGAQIAAPAPVGQIGDIWSNPAALENAWRGATVLAKSQIVPQAYQNKPHDCLIALELATRIGIPPLAVMQNLAVVKGKPSWSGQACTMLVKASGQFINPTPVYFGAEGSDDRGCYLTATRTTDGKTVCGTKITIQMAKAEGWTSNPKWRNMPDQMLAYRAAAFFARVYCPDALMGVQTTEEIYDVDAAHAPAANINEVLNA